MISCPLTIFVMSMRAMSASDYHIQIWWQSLKNEEVMDIFIIASVERLVNFL